MAFHRLVTEGGFQVSAVRRSGTTEFVHVRSTAGEPCRIQPGGLPQPWIVERVQDGTAIPFTVNDGALQFALARNDSAVIYQEGHRPADASIGPVTDDEFHYGLPQLIRGASLPLAIDSQFNNDAITFETNRADGNLGQGYTLPADEMPPPGPFTSDDVQFTFPQYADGLNNSLVPNGQRITVTPGRYSRLDGLGLGVSGTTSIPVVFEYADGSTTSATLRFSDWGREPSNGDIVAVITTHRHHTSGNHSLVVRILHNWVDIDAARDLVAVGLGTASNAHIFALTLEKPI